MIRSFLGKFRAFPAPAPGQTLMVVGDIHGRVDLLARVPEVEGNAQLVFVGDYVDRGPHSADVLRALKVLPDAICLMGNHEEMMLGFVDDPVQRGPRWLRAGGVETLASFGVGPVADISGPADLEAARDALVAAMGPDLVGWLRALPAWWQSGNVGIVHAGADPALPLKDQNARTLRWGHPAFGKARRQDGLWIVHGHTIVPAPVMAQGRINVDTGAYATGSLTVAQIRDGDVTFQTVT